MKKHLLLVTIAFGLLLSSCTKYVDLQPANGIVGSWQLLYVDRQDNFGTTTIYTGFEPGIFHFYYDSHGNYHGGTYQVFDLYLSNYSGTRVIDWQFDESWFSNSSRFNALYYGTNSDYKYVFGRR
jgi:hypothetical protein